MQHESYLGVLWEKPPQDYWLCDFCLLFQLFYDTNKVKSQNFHAILFYLIKKTKWSYILQIPKIHGIDKNINNCFISIKPYITVNISSDDYKFSWCAFNLIPFPEKILLTANMPSGVNKSADECKLWYCYHHLTAGLGALHVKQEY